MFEIFLWKTPLSSVVCHLSLPQRSKSASPSVSRRDDLEISPFCFLMLFCCRLTRHNIHTAACTSLKCWSQDTQSLCCTSCFYSPTCTITLEVTFQQFQILKISERKDFTQQRYAKNPIKRLKGPSVVLIP